MRRWAVMGWSSCYGCVGERLMDGWLFSMGYVILTAVPSALGVELTLGRAPHRDPSAVHEARRDGNEPRLHSSSRVRSSPRATVRQEDPVCGGASLQPSRI